MLCREQGTDHYTNIHKGERDRTIAKFQGSVSGMIMINLLGWQTGQMGLLQWLGTFIL